MTAQPPTDRDAWPVMDATAFRAVVRKWITANWSTGITVREWWRRLADAGLTVPTWSSALGGISATTTIQQVIEDELGRIVTVAPPLGVWACTSSGPCCASSAPVSSATAICAASSTGRRTGAC
ncbi:MAG: acyl-CoA dehydrogenase family protein [Ilumatobacteraceae bacterium]